MLSKKIKTVACIVNKYDTLSTYSLMENYLKYVFTLPFQKDVIS